MFIVFEGIDGSGKTTQSEKLLRYMVNNSKKCLWLREPTDKTEWGKKIRELAESEDSIPIEEELNYFIQDRKWNVRENILPAINKNITVIQDRYFYSTACYQGARGLDTEEILSMNREFAPEPDLLILIDIDIDSAMQRIQKNRVSEAILFEKRDFLLKVRENYLALNHENLVIIDGSQEEDKVFADILKIPALHKLNKKL